MNKKERREWHEMINGLSHAEVEAIVKKSYPQMRPRHVDRIAKLLIEDAHRSISPRRKPAERTRQQ